MKSVVLCSGPVPADPIADIAPLHPPLAWQVSALSACHFSVALAPIDTELGAADSAIVGAGVVVIPLPQPANTRLAATLSAANVCRAANKLRP